MTNETRAALVLLKEQMAAAEEALASFDALVAALQHSAFCAGIGANPRERFAAVRALHAVRTRHEALRERVRSADRLLRQSADFISYQLNVISGTAADDTYGHSQPVAGPGAGVRREIAMFDADV